MASYFDYLLQFTEFRIEYVAHVNMQINKWICPSDWESIPKSDCGGKEGSKYV